MIKEFVNLSLRCVLCVAIPMSAMPAFANEMPKTANGGAGGFPPIDPPVTYADGAPTNPGSNNNGAGQPGYKGTLGQTWGLEANGTKILYTGLLDRNGRTQVYKLAPQGTYGATQNWILRGTVIFDAANPDGKVTWRSGYDTYERLLSEIRASAATPAPTTPTVAATQIPMGELMDGHRAPLSLGSTQTQLVYYQGIRDAQGRPLVFRPATNLTTGKANVEMFKTGVINANGTVTWNAQHVYADVLLAQLRAELASHEGAQAKVKWSDERIARYRERIQGLQSTSYNAWLTRMSVTTGIQAQTIYPNSAYPESGAPKDPLPTNRSLVPVSEVKTLPRIAAPGHSGMNVPQIEYFPEMDPNYKPSAIGRTVNWTNQEIQNMRGEIRKLVRGQPNALVSSGLINGARQTTDVVRRGGIELGRGAAGFYIGMGMMAGIMLAVDHAHNPAAWTAYVRSSTDPIGMASMAAFMGVAGGSYWAMQRASNKYLKPGVANHGATKFGMFSGSLIMGALVGTVLAEMMADPDAGKCMGFTAYKLAGQFTKDYAACDRFWDKWASNSHWNSMAVNQLLPMFANIMVAGGIYQAAMMGTNFLLSRQAVAVAIRSIKFGFSPKGGPWVSLVQMGVQVAIFMGAYHISDQVFGVGQWVRENFTAEWSFSNDPEGNSIKDNERKLLAEYARIKQQRYKNPNLWQNVCVDSSRTFNMFFNCDEPDRLDFTSLLNKYGTMRQNWRRVQMADVENAYNQWRTKSDKYFSMMELSYDYTQGALERIAFESQQTDPAMIEQAGFNKSYTQRFIETQEQLGMPAYLSLKDANLGTTWKYVNTAWIPNFLVTSLACGPEIEFQHVREDNVFSAIGGFWKTYIDGNSAPGQMIENGHGWEMKFFPPRIVNPTQESICETGPRNKPFTLPMGTTFGLAPSEFIVDNAQGQTGDLYAYIKTSIRPSVMENGVIKFQEWWDAHITPATKATNEQLARDYQTILDTDYKKALVRSEYWWCGDKVYTHDNRGQQEIPIAFAPIYARLGNHPADTCAAGNVHRLAHGQANSMRDEMRFYMAMLIDIYASNRRDIGQTQYASDQLALEAAIARGRDMLAQLDKILNAMAVTDPKQRPDVQAIADEYFAKSDAHKREYLARVYPEPPRGPDDRPTPDPAPPRNPHIEEWAFLLGQRIDSVFMEATTLYKILASFEAE